LHAPHARNTCQPSADFASVRLPFFSGSTALSPSWMNSWMPWLPALEHALACDTLSSSNASLSHELSHASSSQGTVRLRLTLTLGVLFTWPNLSSTLPIRPFPHPSYHPTAARSFIAVDSFHPFCPPPRYNQPIDRLLRCKCWHHLYCHRCVNERQPILGAYHLVARELSSYQPTWPHSQFPDSRLTRTVLLFLANPTSVDAPLAPVG